MIAALICLFVAAVPAFNVTQDGVLNVAYSGKDTEVVEEAIGVLQDHLGQLDQRLPSGPEPIHVIICRTQEEFALFAGAYAKNSVAGIARPEEGLIAVKARRLLRNPEDYYNTLRHELVHVLLERNLNCDHMPRWLNEGITMVLAEERRLDSMMVVGQMYLQNRLISYDEFDQAFYEPGIEMKFGDAYAQAHSITRFLLEELGEDGFWTLLTAMDTMSFEEALQKHTALKSEELWDKWRRSLWRVALITAVVSGFGLFQFMALLTIVAYLRRKRKARRMLREWIEEEEEPPYISPWKLEGQDPPYPWEEEDDEYL